MYVKIALDIGGSTTDSGQFLETRFRELKHNLEFLIHIFPFHFVKERVIDTKFPFIIT